MSNVKWDGGGFPRFKSYHDVRLPPHLVGSSISDDRQFRYAFHDFLASLRADPRWQRRFSPVQVCAINEAVRTNHPRIAGFVWHHSQDPEVLQLVPRDAHSVFHYGGRFITGGRPGSSKS